jgi:hypothetical protein
MTVPDFPVVGADLTVLHGGHSAASFEAFHWSYLAVSVLLVGGVGGFLYWYYGTHRSWSE